MIFYLTHQDTNCNSFPASQLLHVELHALQPSTEHVPLGRLRPVAQPSAEVMDALSAEMEKMIIEGAVKQEGGPFKSVWQEAVDKGRRLAAAVLLAPKTPTPQKSFNWGSLPRRGLSPGPSPLKGMGMLNGSPASAPRMQNGVPWPNGNGSDRPSSPRPSADRPSYVRGRSVSFDSAGILSSSTGPF